ncbi:MAG: Fur family transcriptional regulator [Chloroflexota bacterium]
MQSTDVVESIKRVLRDRGLHATSARVSVLEVLREGHEHRSVEDIRAQILERYPMIDPSTVYRTLETLEEHGLAVRVELGDKRTRWAYMTDAHHHMVCRRCGAVAEMGDAPFQRFADDLTGAYGVRVDMQHLVLHGLCRRCAARSDT